MPTNADAEIEQLYDLVKGQDNAAAATLLLAMKIRDLAATVIGVKGAVDGISTSLGIVIDHDAEAIRTTSRPYAP